VSGAVRNRSRSIDRCSLGSQSCVAFMKARNYTSDPRPRLCYSFNAKGLLMTRLTFRKVEDRLVEVSLIGAVVTSIGVHSRGPVNWCQARAGSGGSQGFPVMALLMASSAVMPWAAAVSR
jgi:hypothetical protein